MILYIVTAQPDKAKNAVYWELKHTLAGIAGDICVDVHYSQLSRELVERLDPWAVCHSGAGTYGAYDILENSAYRWVINEYSVAQLGLCKGCQLIAEVLGGRTDYMGPLRDEEPDLAPGYHPGKYKETGVFPVRIVKRDPLFEGLGDIIRVFEGHALEVKELGPEVELLASSTRCRVQAFKHREKPIYGTQFHPEQSPDAYPDGRKVLSNFFAIARGHRS